MTQVTLMKWGKLVVKFQIFSIEQDEYKGHVNEDGGRQLTSKLNARSL